jgi:hypothetical protein
MEPANNPAMRETIDSRLFPYDGEIFEAPALTNKTGTAQADNIHLEPA